MAAILRSALDAEREAQACAADLADAEFDAQFRLHLHQLPQVELARYEDHPAYRQADEDTRLSPLMRAAIAVVLVGTIAASALAPWGFAPGVAP